MNKLTGILVIFSLTTSFTACGGGDPEPDSPTIEIEIHTVEPAPASPIPNLELIRNYPPQKSINPIDCSLTKSCG